MFESISVVLPAYNEANVLGKTLRDVTSYCGSNFKEYEVIVVDDRSEDGTLALASAFPSEHVRVLHNDRNRGKGYSVKRGVMASRHSLVLFMDSDSSLPIENLDGFMPYIERDYDVVIGSRNAPGARILNQQKHRKFLGRAFSFFVSLIALPGLSDTQCGFKLFRSGAAKKVFSLQRLERFSFDVEVLFIARKHGYRIAEAPLTCVYHERSTVSPVKDSLRMLRDLFLIRLNDLRGLYER